MTKIIIELANDTTLGDMDSVCKDIYNKHGHIIKDLYPENNNEKKD